MGYLLTVYLLSLYRVVCLGVWIKVG
uniref:Uncharacterized protein n=1 Tax=Rhizophora mucronata TaxID=61149 RepID=A0A2P2JNL2_RHIMU